MRKKLIIIIALIIVAAIMLISCESKEDKVEKAPFTMTELEVAVNLPPVSLLDHNGRVFDRWNFARMWNFVFFGYTNCPDVCPVALVDMNDIFHKLEDGQDMFNTQFLFISVDPERDTVETLKEYIPFFNKEFIGVTGDPGEIAKLTDKLGIAYIRVPGSKSEEDYLVDHSASILLIDPLMRLRAIFTPPHDAAFMAAEFRKLRIKYKEECCITDEKGETVIFDYRKKENE